MDSAVLGKRIKEARLAKKMTQSEVVGDFITRNMLSQIESGSATPSVKTLEYLSRVLEVPMTYLMPPNGEDSQEDALSLLVKIRDMFLNGEYNEVLELEDTSGILGDEYTALKAKAGLYLAKELSVKKDAAALQKAVDYAKEAAELSAKGVYSNESVRTEAMLLLNSLAQRLAEYYKDMISPDVTSAAD